MQRKYYRPSFSAGVPLTVATCVVALTAGAGCSHPEPLTEIHGTVRIAGIPAANMLVNFVAEERGAASASAVTDDKGFYEIRSSDGRAGAARGRYRVALEDLNLYKIERTDKPPTKENSPLPSRVAGSYRSAASSPLECVIGLQKQELNFDLPAAHP